MWRVVVASFLGMGVVASPLLVAAQPRNASSAITTPAPISSRTLSNPELITPSDIVARLVLAHETLELIHTYMGRPAPKQAHRLVVEKSPPLRARCAKIDALKSMR